MSWILIVLWISGFFLTLQAQTDPCTQGGNCKLPLCYCGKEGAPGGLKGKDIPQMVIIVLDGHLDSTRDRLYNTLLPDSLRNPNGCKRSATMFVRGKGTNSKLVEKWYRRGIEIGLNSEIGTGTWNFWDGITRQQMKGEVLVPLDRLEKETEIPRKAIIGYRSPTFTPAGNVQYQVLEYEDFQYDASIKITRQTILETNIWPSTLDFPWGYRCVGGKCPTNSYKGFWEVPSVSLINGTEYTQHHKNVFATATEFPAKTKKEMFDFLMNNFEAFYDHDRAPFLLNLRADALLTASGKERLLGVVAFLQQVRKRPDVFLVSIHQALQWMKTPTPMNKMDLFEPWSCPENEGTFKEVPKGKPIELHQLTRESKAKALFGRGRGAGCSSSFIAMGVNLVTVLLCVLRTWDN